MAFSGLRGASSGLLAVLKKGPRLRRRKAPKTPALISSADTPPNTIASLAQLTKIIGLYLSPKDVERIKEAYRFADQAHLGRSEEHTSELQSLMRISYAVFCLKKKTTHTNHRYIQHTN